MDTDKCTVPPASVGMAVAWPLRADGWDPRQEEYELVRWASKVQKECYAIHNKRFMVRGATAMFGIWVSLQALGGSPLSAQFREIPPPPMSPGVAREYIRSLLRNVHSSNRQQTLSTISGLLIWYRDLFDEELVAGWKGNGRASLVEIVESLPDLPVAIAIVQYSWRLQPEAAFIPAYAPMLELLMTRYPASAKPFLDDLLGPAANGSRVPALPALESEAACRILLDLPEWVISKNRALTILSYYGAMTERLLDGDIHDSNPEKRNAALRWIADLKAAGKVFGLPQAPALSVANNRNRPVDTGILGAPAVNSEGVILTRLNPDTVDGTPGPSSSGTQLLIDFVNLSETPVDIYSISYSGDRVLYHSGLAVAGTWAEATYVNDRWLVVASGTGGTKTRGSGTALAAFQAEMPNNTAGVWTREAAIITGLKGPVTRSTDPSHRAEASSDPSGRTYATNAEVLPSVSYKVDPDYTELARKQSISGTVTLSMVIDSTGSARDIRVVKGLGYGLDETAAKAVSQWQFKPAMANGKPVNHGATIEVNFALRANSSVVSSAGKTDDLTASVNRETGPSVIVSGRDPAPLPPPAQSSDSNPPSLPQTSQPAVVYKVEPQYDDVARLLFAEGTVTLAIVVDGTGRARDIQVVKGLGYGLDEKAVEAVSQWRFKSGMKDGKAINARATIEVNFRLGDLGLGHWLSGPLTFASKAGATVPIVKSGTMPKPVDELSSESLTLGFTVDPNGAVKNIHYVDGSPSGARLLTGYLAKWRFQPSVLAGQPTEASGTVTFVKRAGDAPIPATPGPRPTPPTGESGKEISLAQSPATNLPPQSIPSQASSRATRSPSVDGMIRRLTEKALIVQTSSGVLFRFRLLAITEFRDRDGRPVRDSLVRPGDHVTIRANPDDVETALSIILIATGNSSEREIARLGVNESQVLTPDLGNIGDPRP